VELTSVKWLLSQLSSAASVDADSAQYKLREVSSVRRHRCVRRFKLIRVESSHFSHLDPLQLRAARPN
jgi:hypothetical protein